jgi:hypothetical protein
MYMRDRELPKGISIQGKMIICRESTVPLGCPEGILSPVAHFVRGGVVPGGGGGAVGMDILEATWPSMTTHSREWDGKMYNFVKRKF